MSPARYREGRFPLEDRLDWRALAPLIGPAVAALARYDGTLAAIPNADVLIAPLATQEAVLSSRIEGTRATMGEVLEFEAAGEAASPEMQNDIVEVLNYRAAMREAEKMLENLPLSQRVVREAHRVLLSGARGKNKAPGEYRRVPNWIGPPGCSIDTATYVPVGPEKLADAMSAWERYMHENAPDLLVQAAVLHAEFEAIHPFLDGNGRLGRMLIPLFLWRRGLIRRPMFYISAYFEAHRDAYYDGLLAVSRDDDWTGWCRFFLEGARAGGGQSGEDQGDSRSLRGDEAPRPGIDPLPIRRPGAGLDVRASDFPGRRFYEEGGHPEADGVQGLEDASSRRNPERRQNGARPQVARLFVPGLAQHRGREESVFMIMYET